MANRISLGRRRSGSGDRGLMISGLDTSSGAGSAANPYGRADVTSVDSNNKGNVTHNFDSQEHVGGGYHVYYYGQGSLASNAQTVISHNWGTNNKTATADRPLFAVRWSYSSEVSNGIASTSRTCGVYEADDTNAGFGDFGGGQQTKKTIFEGVLPEHINKDTIRIKNVMLGGSGGVNSHNGHTIYWALVVFYEDDYNGGRSI